ncbi:polyprenol monophosphomannose synthase [Thermospira aquatica]|uniref:Polyprenol monophosphomannose synthase n=1 Tax=Thermospira aquatica TaxID=2828656 RepID=A0AAX3BET1_9SPIR|nr:polyprenol monophosphomannose synthase [Thermospira aquatica]URA10569.1 polyprenol monophosphomannose synthase [Thermospira aquatica]
MKTVVIIPTYNERENIEKLIPVVLTQGENIHVLVVDDNSPDGTASVVQKMREKNPRVHCLVREKKEGLGRAYIAGMRWALESSEGFEIFIEMDADFSHDPGELFLFFDAFAKGADVVCGSRYTHGVRVLNWDLKRLLLSLGGNVYARFATGVPLTDLTGGYNGYTRQALEKIDLSSIRSNGYAFQIEMKAKAYYHGLRVVEVPIIFRDRYEGTTKMHSGIVNEALFQCWAIRFSKYRIRRSRPVA